MKNIQWKLYFFSPAKNLPAKSWAAWAAGGAPGAADHTNIFGSRKWGQPALFLCKGSTHCQMRGGHARNTRRQGQWFHRKWYFLHEAQGENLLPRVLLIIKLPAFFVKRCLFQPIQYKAAEQKQQQGAISRQAPVHNKLLVHKGRRRNILRENMHGNV